jgi:cytochrome P450
MLPPRTKHALIEAVKTARFRFLLLWRETIYSLLTSNQSKMTPPWIESYENHILHCSLYIAVAACAFQWSSIPFTSFLDVFPPLVGGFSVLNLCVEINYIIKRIGLPPGNSGFPIFGNVVQVIRRGPRALKVDFFRKYQSPLVTMNIFMRPLVVVKDEEDVRWWLIQERKGNVVPHQLPHVLKLIGHEAIFVQHSAAHRRLRRIFEPSFSPSVVRGYVDLIDATTQAELEKWSSQDGFCSSNDWAILAMRLFFVCAFGKVDEDVLETLSRSFQTWGEGFGSVIPVAWLPGTKVHKAHIARAEMFQILKRLVSDFKEKNPPGSPGVDNRMMGRLCYGVDDEGEPLSEDQLITNIIFILFAGHDTTKGSFCAFAHYLTELPNVRSQLLEEVNTYSELLDVDELKAAPVLNAFLAETWRLVPPLSSHVVCTAKDMEYKGYKFRKGTGVAIDIQAFHVLDEERYPDPWGFRLDRWLPKDHPLHNPKYFQEGVDYNVPSTKYRSFGMGTHMCLGAHFAKLEARIVLTRLLQRYDIDIRSNEQNKVPLLQYNNEFKLTRR